jgi:hypothetical protein
MHQLLIRRITIMLLLHVPYYNYNEVLGREQHDMSAACQQGKVELRAAQCLQHVNKAKLKQEQHDMSAACPQGKVELRAARYVCSMSTRQS